MGKEDIEKAFNDMVDYGVACIDNRGNHIDMSSRKSGKTEAAIVIMSESLKQGNDVTVVGLKENDLNYYLARLAYHGAIVSSAENFLNDKKEHIGYIFIKPTT